MNLSSQNNADKQDAAWMQDPRLKDIPKHKLELLQIMVFESKNLKQDEMLPFFMSVMKISKEKKISFIHVACRCFGGSLDSLRR